MKQSIRWQVPLTVAFALTIPGAQGSEFDILRVDLRGHNDGAWLPHALYTAASRGKFYRQIKFINIPELNTNIICDKMKVVEEFMQKLKKEYEMELKENLATLDYAATLQNIVIRSGTKVDEEARKMFASNQEGQKQKKSRLEK